MEKHYSLLKQRNKEITQLMEKMWKSVPKLKNKLPNDLYQKSINLKQDIGQLTRDRRSILALGLEENDLPEGPIQIYNRIERVLKEHKIPYIRGQVQNREQECWLLFLTLDLLTVDLMEQTEKTIVLFSVIAQYDTDFAKDYEQLHNAIARSIK